MQKLEKKHITRQLEQRGTNNMYDMRMLGNSCYLLSKQHNILPKQIAEAIGSTEAQVEGIFCGRCFMSYHQLCIMASLFRLNAEELLEWDEKHNTKRTIYGLHTFEDIREYNEKDIHYILDIIDDYITLREVSDTIDPKFGDLVAHRRECQLVQEEPQQFSMSKYP